MTYFTRLRRAVASGFIGWLAGFLASVPAMLVVGWRDSEHDPKIFAATIGIGLLAWAGWTLLLALAAWLLFALAVALLVSPVFLATHRRAALIFTTLFTLAVVAFKLYSFQDISASHLALRFVLYMPYGTFAMLFAVATAWWYLRNLS